MEIVPSDSRQDASGVDKNKDLGDSNSVTEIYQLISPPTNEKSMPKVFSVNTNSDKNSTGVGHHLKLLTIEQEDGGSSNNDQLRLAQPMTMEDFNKEPQASESPSPVPDGPTTPKPA